MTEQPLAPSGSTLLNYMLHIFSFGIQNTSHFGASSAATHWHIKLMVCTGTVKILLHSCFYLTEEELSSNFPTSQEVNTLPFRYHLVLHALSNLLAYSAISQLDLTTKDELDEQMCCKQ